MVLEFKLQNLLEGAAAAAVLPKLVLEVRVALAEFMGVVAVVVERAQVQTLEQADQEDRASPLLQHMLNQTVQHKVKYDPWDDGEPILFRWHFPRGTLSKRMSGFELATFLMPHMPNVLPLLSGHPRAYKEFQEMLNRLVLWPQNMVDEILPWIKSLTRTEDQDIIELNIGAKSIEVGPAYFVLGGK